MTATPSESPTVYVTGTANPASVYHDEGCPLLNRAKNAWPKTLDIARRAGWGPCGRCDPPE